MCNQNTSRAWVRSASYDNLGPRDNSSNDKTQQDIVTASGECEKRIGSICLVTYVSDRYLFLGLLETINFGFMLGTTFVARCSLMLELEVLLLLLHSNNGSTRRLLGPINSAPCPHVKPSARFPNPCSASCLLW